MSTKRLHLKTRVRAVVAATRMAMCDGDRAPRAPWTIIAHLEYPTIELAYVRELINEALTEEIDVNQRPYFRLYAAELETLLGLSHHPVTAEAVERKAASEGMRGLDTPWLDYVRQVKREAAHGVLP